MSDKPELLSAILADYRADIPAMTRGELPHPTPEYLRILLDRIEAAAKQEEDRRRDEVLSLQRTIVKMQDAIARQADAVNSAAMREALVEILNRTNREKARDYDAALNGGILEIHDIANTAINQTKGE